MKIRALSIKQPWANMIADGKKTIETRSWGTGYKGPLLIVSSKKPDTIALSGEPAADHGPYRYAIATAFLARCRPMHHGDQDAACCQWYQGAIAWMLEDIKRIKPFPVRGRQGLYQVEMPEDTP